MSDLDEPDVTEQQKVYRAAFLKVAANHVMGNPGKDGVVTCECGDTGQLVDMQGHYGPEASRAGDAAVAAM